MGGRKRGREMKWRTERHARLFNSLLGEANDLIRKLRQAGYAEVYDPYNRQKLGRREFRQSLINDRRGIKYQVAWAH